ncbi:hypothetical protein ACOMHN_039420 [Nucella lapillus]
MQCPVCLETRELRITNCGNKHSFCVRCLQALRVKHGRRFPCPLCRQGVNLTPHDAASFPVLPRSLFHQRSRRHEELVVQGASGARLPLSGFPENIFCLQQDGSIRRGLLPLENLGPSRPSSPRVPPPASHQSSQRSSLVPLPPIQQLAPAASRRAVHPRNPQSSLTSEQRLPHQRSRHRRQGQSQQQTVRSDQTDQMPSTGSARDQDMDQDQDPSAIFQVFITPTRLPFRLLDLSPPTSPNENPSEQIARPGITGHFPSIGSNLSSGMEPTILRNDNQILRTDNRRITNLVRQARIQNLARHQRFSVDRLEGGDVPESSGRMSESGLASRSAALITSILGHIRDTQALDAISQRVRQRAKQVEEEQFSRAAQMHRYERRFGTRVNRRHQRNDVRVVGNTAKDGWLQYFETGSRAKPSRTLQLIGGHIDDMGNCILGIGDGRGHYLTVRAPADKEHGQRKVVPESQTADNTKATNTSGHN